MFCTSDSKMGFREFQLVIRNEGCSRFQYRIVGTYLRTNTYLLRAVVLASQLPLK